MDARMIEVILWDNTGLMGKIFSPVKSIILCIRYDADYFVALVSGKPTLIEAKKIREDKITFREMREVIYPGWKLGKDFLTRSLKERWSDAKLYLKAYISVMNPRRDATDGK